MKPLPHDEQTKDPARAMPSLPLNATSGTYSTSNRRISTCSVQRVYPWLLFASTAVAATFCLAYISKPVILSGPPGNQTPVPATQTASSTKPAILPGKIVPDSENLPGEQAKLPSASAEDGIPPAALSSDFEETNIRMQHILDAASPSGDLNRIIIDVPVLYESRNLRWTQEDAAQARLLLQRLTEHQEKTRILRDEGKILLQAWNELVDGSIPTQALRADSPSLPSNQRNTQASVPPAAGIIKLKEPSE